MLIKKPSDIKSSEITDQKTYLNRRNFIVAASASGAAIAAGLGIPRWLAASRAAQGGAKIDGVRPSPLSINEKPTPFKDITNYNNFYEFGTDKYSPAQFAKSLKTRPWTVSVEGLVKRPKVYDIDQLLKL